jgi:hypothetical protein
MAKKKTQYTVAKATVNKSGNTLLQLQEKTSYGYATYFVFEHQLAEKMLKHNFEII